MQKIIYILISFSFLFCSCRRPGGSLPSSTPVFDSAIIVAERLYDSGSKSEALRLIRSKHASLPGLGLDDHLNYYAYISAIYERDYKDYDKCIELADSMLHLLWKSGQINNMPIRHIQAINIRADALYFKGFYNEAYKAYFAAKVLATANEDPCAVSMYSYHMGMILYRQQKYRDAAGYFKQAYGEVMNCVENFTYFYRRQEILDNIGLSYEKAGMHDSALIYFNKSLAYIHSSYNKFPAKPVSVYESAEAVVYGNMAESYLAMGKPDTAIGLLEKSIAVNLKRGYVNSDAELSQVKLANIYLKQGRQEALKGVLYAMRAELDTIPDAFVGMQWNNLMYQYYTRGKDSLSACKYAVAYIKQNDSFQASNKLLVASDIAGTMRSMERQHQLSLLEKEKEMRDVYLIIAAIIAIMAIVVIFMILRNSARSSKDLDKLKGLNQEIGSQKGKLENVLHELEARDKDKSRILRSVAHDVMSPISAIAALADILLTEGGNFTGEQKEILELIQEACGNSLSLSNEILEAADTIDPRSMSKENVSVNKLLHSCIELLSVKAALKGQEIVVGYEQPDVAAIINKDKVRRVIENLLGNAIKFSFEGSKIIVSLSYNDGNVLITIKDTGVGISEKSKKGVFDMFTESKTYGTLGEKPHGIGLSIALQVAKAHNGNIWFDSEEGKGTTFYFTFPGNL